MPARSWLVRHCLDFAGLGLGASYLWPRWLVLRAVGLVYVVIFAGIFSEGRLLLGPNGVVPAADYFARLTRSGAGVFELLSRAPTVFWLNPGPGMLMALNWLGLTAALALVFNLWPRLALAVCWLTFLSFVTTWGEFSPAQLDGLMLETALLCVPFAPRGIRPGLGAHSPPRPIAVFMVRWLLFRVMFESGLVKLISTDPSWRNLTAMDFMYQTSPAPTVLGYWAHQLPHAWHLLEVGLTFAAEIIAPVLAIFGGRRGRWIALALWIAFQTGIQLTCNFGWLNLAAIGLGLLLLDDQMLTSAARRLGWRRLEARFAAATVAPMPLASGWSRHGLRVALGLHFVVTLYYFALAANVPAESIPSVIRGPITYFREFRSANRYYLYANVHPAHFQIDFEGSNDGGRTWRTYEYRFLPQREDQRPRFIAPWFPRFENTVLFESSRNGGNSVVSVVAGQLLTGNPEVRKFFARDPFPDRAPSVIRMRRYRLTFTDPVTLRTTGHYWHKELEGDYLPPLALDESGELVRLTLAPADAALQAGDFVQALALYQALFDRGYLEAGFRVADFYARGLGVPQQPAKVFAIFADLANRGEVRAFHSLGLCYEYGVGVAPDLVQAAAHYRRAAEGGHVPAMYALGLLSSRDRRIPRDDVDGLFWLLRAKERAGGDEPAARLIRENQPAQVEILRQRMSPDDIATARARAARP